MKASFFVCPTPYLFTLAFIIFSFSNFPGEALGENKMDCKEREPYVAPPYQPPEKIEENSKNLIDNEDGTLTDKNTKLMWSQKDSYADLNHCLNWTDSKSYVENLSTGGHTNWRMPTIKELITIYDSSKENVLAWDQDPENPLRMDDQFAGGAAYWYWSSDCGHTEMTQCCAKTLYFPKGLVHLRRFEICNNGGVRAVRNID